MGEFHFHHPSQPTPPRRVAQVPLPQSVENMIEKICLEKQQDRPDYCARRKLAEIGEDKAYEIVRRIYYSKQPIRTNLSRYIIWFVDSPQSPVRLTSSPPTPTPPPPSNLFQSPLKRALHFPTYFSYCTTSIFITVFFQDFLHWGVVFTAVILSKSFWKWLSFGFILELYFVNLFTISIS